MNIHNLSKSDLILLKYELTQYKLGNITTEELSPELTEILNAVKQVTVHSQKWQNTTHVKLNTKQCILFYKPNTNAFG